MLQLSWMSCTYRGIPCRLSSGGPAWLFLGTHAPADCMTNNYNGSISRKASPSFPIPSPSALCTPHASWHLNCSRKLCQECWAPAGIVSVAVATASNELLAAAAAITPLLATLKSMQFSHLSLCSGLCFVYRNETFERGELSRAIAPTTVSDWIGEPCRATDQLLLLSWFFHFHFLLFIYGVHPIGAHVLRPSLTVALTLLNLTI